MSKFIKPDFIERHLELRYENNEVCIYGTQEGLKKLSELILKLADNPKQGHIHLEDYQLLTDKSLIGVVAIFDKEKII
ncbi:MAG: hypothetical protein V1869_06330 [Candidatus Omnitrophota bacterium]